MNAPANQPWIVTLSARIYRKLLTLGPTDYVEEYGEQTVQDFRLCCLDAYRDTGWSGVLRLWPGLFGEVLLGMIAEHFTAERMKQMLPAMRNAMLITFGAFLLFGIAFVFLLRLVDPLPPFTAFNNAYPDLWLEFHVMNWCAQLAFLLIISGGLPIVFVAIKTALLTKGNNLWTLLGWSWKRALFLLGISILIESGFLLFLFGLIFVSSGGTIPFFSTQNDSLPPLLLAEQIGILTLFTTTLLGSAYTVAHMILRSEFSTRMLRYALALMAATTLTMSCSCAMLLIWALRLKMVAPTFTVSGAGLGMWNGTGFGLIVMMMILAIAASILALRRGIQVQRGVARN